MGDINLGTKLKNLGKFVADVNTNVIVKSRDWLKSKNLIKYTNFTISGVNAKTLSNGYIRFYGTNTSQTANAYLKVDVSVEVGKTYTLYGLNTDLDTTKVGSIYVYDNANNVRLGSELKKAGDSTTFTLTNPSSDVHIYLKVFPGQEIDYTLPLMFVEGVNIVDFEPYSKSNVELTDDLSTLIETLKSKGVID